VLRRANAIVETSLEMLPQTLAALLDDADRRAQLAKHGRETIAAAQGATEAAMWRLVTLAKL
jgi:hypothetical protein